MREKKLEFFTKNNMQQKKLIIFIIILFLISSAYLFFINEKHLNSGKDWWAVYFVEVKNQNLDFVIENNTDKNEFKFEVLSDENVLKSENVSVFKGEIKNIGLNLENLGKKITIKVYSGEEKREIYKNL